MGCELTLDTRRFEVSTSDHVGVRSRNMEEHVGEQWNVYPKKTQICIAAEICIIPL